MKLLLLLNVFGFGVIVFFTLVVAKTTHARLLILGWICLIFSLSVFVAPLGVMVIEISALRRSIVIKPFISFLLSQQDINLNPYQLLTEASDSHQECQVHAILPLILPYY